MEQQYMRENSNLLKAIQGKQNEEQCLWELSSNFSGLSRSTLNKDFISHPTIIDKMIL